MNRYRAGSGVELGGGCTPPKLTYGLKVVMKLMKFGIVMLLSEKNTLDTFMSSISKEMQLSHQ